MQIALQDTSSAAATGTAFGELLFGLYVQLDMQTPGQEALDFLVKSQWAAAGLEEVGPSAVVK